MEDRRADAIATKDSEQSAKAADDTKEHQKRGSGEARDQTAADRSTKQSTDENGKPTEAKLADDHPRQKRQNDDVTGMPESDPSDEPTSTASSDLANIASKTSDSKTAQPAAKFSLQPQQNRSGQNTMTGRRRLKITARLAAIAKANDLPGEEMEVRENVVAIDKMLAEIETGLKQLLDHRIADADRAEHFRRLDVGLGNIETYVAELREQTKLNQYAFVGLQMVDITRTHVTPARDRVFAAIQRPNASDADASVALQQVVRARELLAALLQRYDRVVQDKKMKRSLDETVTMYEVYVEKRRSLMRESRQNRNPLDRKMGIIEVDQAYLDRLAEVVKLRREMMDEFAQMLGDDPRLLSRYLELVKRRSKSLRDRLSEISQRQYDATEEVLGWLKIVETQKQDLWTIIVELRLHTANELAKDAAELAERIEKQMPLELDAAVGTPADTIRQAKQIASLARTIQFDAETVIAAAGKVEEQTSLLSHARTLAAQFDRLSATFDRLLFENEGDDAISDYVEPRMLEIRTVADQADAWAILIQSLADQSYAGIVKTEQQRIAVQTQTLRVEMLDMKTDLESQFQRLTESPMPVEIVAMIEQLHRLMETITFNQAAASYRAAQDQLDSVAGQQQLATARLSEAEELFDKIRRSVANALDEYKVQDPNIADLRDPTLDEFLARLEREPNIAAQLGIPDRPRNLRVIADSVFWQESGAGALGDSGEAAAARMKEAMKMKRANKKSKQDAPAQGKLSQEERERQEEAKKAQQMLEKSLVEIKKQQADPKTSEQQRRRLEKLAEDVQQMLEPTDGDNGDRRAWERLVQSDEATALLRAISKGEAIPDQQWNKLLSTLDDGLWQVRGKQPPAAYRKAIEQYQDQIRELMQTIDEE
ncbi:myosin heavy chain [Rhodopirellula maiorica SM1]|uniref:Myosin heavy chain n=1 Tax=Rhodopirellula maiorica SM1 TaxID=1265738 RepID=M5RXI0_9BACT|nr:myosin heavy chain [Rhodopirellula maiorica SM1]